MQNVFVEETDILVSYSVLEQDILSIGLEGLGIPDPNSKANSILDFLRHQPS